MQNVQTVVSRVALAGLAALAGRAEVRAVLPRGSYFGRGFPGARRGAASAAGPRLRGSFPVGRLGAVRRPKDESAARQ